MKYFDLMARSNFEKNIIKRVLINLQMYQNCHTFAFFNIVLCEHKQEKL